MQLRGGRLHPGADVERAADRLRGDAGADERVDDVTDVDVVAGGAAVAEMAVGRPVSIALPKIATTPASPCGSWRGP